MFTALNSIQVMIGTVTLIVALAAGVWLWLRKKKQARSGAKEAAAGKPEEPAPTPRGMGLPVLLREISRQLKHAKASDAIDASSLRHVPVVLVVGPFSHGKTSVIAESRLRPELQATQSCGDGDTSEAWRVWLAERTVFVAVPESAAADADTLRLLGRHVRPGFWSLLRRQIQPPRSILFCAEQSMVSLQSDSRVAEVARTWNSRLCRLCEALCAQVGIYVLVTGLDGVEGFTDFASVLGDDETAQPAGVTLPAFHPDSRQQYSEWIDKIVPESFARIVHSLRDARPAVMSRERDPQKLARQYEFAKSFERLQDSLGVFLRELTMTSQVRIQPFLRGYYFCGTCAVIRRGAPKDPVVVKAREPEPEEGSVTATSVLDPKKRKAGVPGAGPEVAQQQEVTEWLFLPELLRDVLLADQPAREVSGRSWCADLVRAWAIGAGAGALFLLGLALTVSYVRNRGLELQLLAGGKVVVQGTSPSDPLARLETMRPGLQRLIEYYYEPPWSMRWGLNHTRRLVSPAQTLYCTAAREQVVEPLRKQIEARLGSLKTTAGNPVEDYRLLEAYMMMTTHPDKANADFISSVLLELAKSSGDIGANSNRNALLGAQLQTYGSLLAISDANKACVFNPPAGLIGSAQAYLRLNFKDRYQSLLQQAGAGLRPVDYNASFPNDAVRDAHVVPGHFTRPGWDKIQGILRKPQSLKADSWVLDQPDELQSGQLNALADQLRAQYQNDYIREWQEFLRAGQVSQYANLKDAAAKLEKMTGQRSFLLNLVGLVSQNTAFDPVKPVFQPALSVVAANGDFQAAKYLEQLDLLKNRLLKAADSTGAAHEQDAQEVRGAAMAAQDAADQIAGGFKGDSDQLVKNILLRPITQINGLLAQQNAQVLNGAGKDFCGDVETVIHALPFARSSQSAPLDSVQRLLAPAGRMWKFYNEFLQDSLTCGDDGCYAKEAPKYPLSKGFEHYFSALYRWSRLLFGTGGDPVVRLQLQAPKYNHVQKLEVTLDELTVSLTPGSPQPTALSWDLRRTSRLQVTGTFEGEPSPQKLFQADGQWTIFEWLANAEGTSGGSGGFVWIPRSGTIKPIQLENKHTIEYKLSILGPDGSGRALDLRSLTPGACVPPIR